MGYQLATVHAVSLGDQATSTLTKYLTQSHCPDTVLASACSILNTRLPSNRHQFKKNIGFKLSLLYGNPALERLREGETLRQREGILNMFHFPDTELT